MIKIINAKISPEDESLDELVSNTEKRMAKYSSKHPDFSCIIDKYQDDNYIIIRTLKLEECAN